MSPWQDAPLFRARFGPLPVSGQDTFGHSSHFNEPHNVVLSREKLLKVQGGELGKFWGYENRCHLYATPALWLLHLAGIAKKIFIQECQGQGGSYCGVGTVRLLITLLVVLWEEQFWGFLRGLALLGRNSKITAMMIFFNLLRIPTSSSYSYSSLQLITSG